MNPPIVITTGMGIGPEILSKTLLHKAYKHRIVLLGRSYDSFLHAIPQVRTIHSNLPVTRIHPDHIPNPYHEPIEVASIRYGTQLCLKEQALALVTGPINKDQLNQQGFGFTGHTDFLEEICNAKAVMGFVGGDIRVALATVHMPLMQVGQQLSTSSLCSTLQIIHRSLQQDLSIFRPKIIVCGLNPHAGENGRLGFEEMEIIEPACSMMRDQGLDVLGPVSAETAFLKAKQKEVDLVLAMYHDQGLAPLKALSFGTSINWSMGLPIIRTSVDHGTADDIVGRNIADPSSMKAALDLAIYLIDRRVNQPSQEVSEKREVSENRGNRKNFGAY